MRDLTKSERKLIKKFLDIAYETELSNELISLQNKFSDWKQKKINCFELNDEVHKYHDNVQRELWKTYQMNSLSVVALVNAIKRGVIPNEQVPQELNDILNPKK